MLSLSIFSPLGLIEIFLGAITFTLLLRSKSLAAYWPLLIFALWDVVPGSALFMLREYRIFSAQAAYDVYFGSYWLPFACAAFCAGLLTYTIFKETLRPLKGLQSLGRIMFRWILAITLALTLSVALEANTSLSNTIIEVVTEFQRLSAIVVLGLIAFVITTVRPLGLTFRSRIFGVSLGMCLVVSSNLWTATRTFGIRDLQHTSSLFVASASCLAQMIWIWYFAVPEPTRKFLLLPTTSPFHQWNLVSERMGYDPGYVAIGGVPPESFAEAERKIFERIAEQDSGKAPRLDETASNPAIPSGWSSATAEATERFQRAWDFRYMHEVPPERDETASQSDQPGALAPHSKAVAATPLEQGGKLGL